MTDAAGHLTDELSALLDGELSPDEADAVHAHLAECAVCTAELAAVDRTRDLVRSLPMVDPPNVVHLESRREAAAAAATHDAEAKPAAVPLIAIAAAIVFVLLQWLPADRAVAPSLAGFGRTHSSVVQAASTQPSAGSALRLVRAPTSLAPGYQRVAVYRKGSLVHAVYTDGSHALSLFAQAGQLDEDRLPGDGTVVERKGHTLHHWERPEGDVVLWQSRGVVYTAVGDAPVEQVMEAAASMPGEDPAFSVGQRLRRGCRALAEAITGG